MFFFVSFFSMTLKAANDKTAIPLVKNGKSDYAIIVAPNATAREKRAVSLLQDYVFKISGYKLPTATKKVINAVYIKMGASIKHPDGFSINTTGQDIVIEGGIHKGCIYAVISLLEKYMGCHYYSPTFKVIPASKNIDLPSIHFSDEPKNDCRIVYFNEKVDDEYLDWNRLNMADEYFADGYYVHTFNRLVPSQEHFQTHPEYFAMVNGKRSIDQLCLTNVEVLKLVIAKLEKEMLGQPGKLYWSVSQNDNAAYCHCANCQKINSAEQSPAGTIIRFVNEVAKHFPTKIISTLAYQYSRPAPAITRPVNNVQVMLCTIELNRSKTIEQDKDSKSFVKDITDWGKICRNIYLWDYVIDFAHSVSPFPNLHVLQPNIQFFARNQVRSHFQQSNSSTGLEFAELKVYLISRLLWNPDINVAQVMDDFLTGYYGKAAPWIKRYVNQLQSELIKSGDRLDIYEHPMAHRNSFLSAANINDYNYFFDQATASVSDDSARLMHVKISRLPLQYAMMEIGKNDMLGARGWYVEKSGEFSIVDKMQRTLDDFNTTCKKAGVPYLNESRLTPKVYYESSTRLLDIDVKGNYAFRKKVTTETPPSPDNSNGDLSILTNGIKGASDYKVQWLGWEGKDFNLVLDLERTVNAASIEISSLWDPKSWVLHPASVSCLVSKNGKDYTSVGKIVTEGDQQQEEISRVFKFKAPGYAVRYIKFEIKGTIHLFGWHPSAGWKSWVFIDEITVH